MLGKPKQRVSKEAPQEGSREEQRHPGQKREPGHSLQRQPARAPCAQNLGSHMPSRSAQEGRQGWEWRLDFCSGLGTIPWAKHRPLSCKTSHHRPTWASTQPGPRATRQLSEHDMWPVLWTAYPHRHWHIPGSCRPSPASLKRRGGEATPQPPILEGMLPLPPLDNPKSPPQGWSTCKAGTGGGSGSLWQLGKSSLQPQGPTCLPPDPGGVQRSVFGSLDILLDVTTIPPDGLKRSTSKT